MRLMKRSALLVAAVAAFTLAAAKPAQAETIVGASYDVGLMSVGDFSFDGLRGGQGGKLWAGYQLNLILFKLSLEAGGGYRSFGGADGDEGARLLHGFAGARASVGAILQPSVYAQVGYGRLSLMNVEGAGTQHSAGFTGEAGLAFDFTLLPLVNLGAHAGYQYFQSLGNVGNGHLLLAGLHASLAF